MVVWPFVRFFNAHLAVAVCNGPLSFLTDALQAFYKLELLKLD